MSKKTITQYFCDRCGKEIQSANTNFFRKYIQRESVQPVPEFSKFEISEVSPISTSADASVYGKYYGSTMTGVELTVSTPKTICGNIHLCAECAESLADWWDDGNHEATPFGYLETNPFRDCGISLSNRWEGDIR